jgi:hypothetical protein
LELQEDEMAKAEKMNRGVKNGKHDKGHGSEIRLPVGVHSIDSHGNIFASLAELSRVQPKYYTFGEIESAIDTGALTALTAEDLTGLQTIIARR